jgi:micrococcal nuclease
MDEFRPHRRWYHRRRHQAWLSVLTLIVAVAIAYYSDPNVARLVQAAQPGTWQVVRDVDGDTIIVRQGSDQETVRFIGMDTPETHKPNTPVQCYGPEAAAFTKSQVEGRNVRLAPDPQDSDKDKYGRILRYVYLPDGTLLNAELIQKGYAFAYVVFPFTKLDQFKQLQVESRAAAAGLWTACNINSSDIILQTAGAK